MPPSSRASQPTSFAGEPFITEATGVPAGIASRRPTRTLGNVPVITAAQGLSVPTAGCGKHASVIGLMSGAKEALLERFPVVSNVAFMR